MSVRRFLALLVGAELALVADIRSGSAQRAVSSNGKHHDVAGGIVGDEKIFAGFVKGEVTGVFAERGHLIQQRQLATLRIDRKRADRAILCGFVCGVKKFTVGMNRYPGRIRRFGGNTDGREFSRTRVVAKTVDAFARGLGCVRTHKRQIIPLCISSLLSCLRRKQRGESRQKK